MNRFNPTTYIDKDPPLDQSPQSMIDYMAYLKEQFNFIMNGVNKRMGPGDVVGNDSVIEAINNSPETVKINANRVNVTAPDPEGYLAPQAKTTVDTNTWTDGRVVNVPFVTTTDIGAASTGTNDVTTAWLKYVCAHYKNKTRCIFTGCVQASSYKMLQVLIYETNVVNSSGVPQYSMGFFVHYGGDTMIVGTNNYSVYSQQVNTYTFGAYVTSQGTSSVGVHYRVWSNGWKECWYKRTANVACTSAWGNLYTSGGWSRVAFPVAFTSPPHEIVTASGNNSTSVGSAWVIPYGNSSGPTTTQTGQYQVVRPTSTTTNFTIEYYACGY